VGERADWATDDFRLRFTARESVGYGSLAYQPADNKVTCSSF